MGVDICASSPESGIVGHSQDRVCPALPHPKCRAGPASQDQLATYLFRGFQSSPASWGQAHCFWPFLTCHSLNLCQTVLPSTSPQPPPSWATSDTATLTAQVFRFQLRDPGHASRLGSHSSSLLSWLQLPAPGPR